MNFPQKLPDEPGHLYYISPELVELIKTYANLHELSSIDIIKQSVRLGSLLFFGIQKGSFEPLIRDAYTNQVYKIEWFDNLPFSQVVRPLAKLESDSGSLLVLQIGNELHNALKEVSGRLGYSNSEVLVLFIHEYLNLLNIIDEGGEMVIIQDGFERPLDLTSLKGRKSSSE